MTVRGWAIDAAKMLLGAGMVSDDDVLGAAEIIERAIAVEGDRCDSCKRVDVPVYRPPHDDGTYPGECGRCLMAERDRYKHALERVAHEMSIAKSALDPAR